MIGLNYSTALSRSCRFYYLVCFQSADLVEYSTSKKEALSRFQNDDLNTQSPHIVENPGWNRRFKNHDKVHKRLMTGAEASERDADRREKIAAQGAQLQALGVSLLPPTSSFLARGRIERPVG
jgi:uncharacterized membrane protein (UPF0182 family)